MKTKRNTKHKQAIVDVFEKNHLLTMQELSEKLPHITFSTIYRNIETFVVEGVLTKITLQDGAVAYELAHDPHDHFICKSCNTVDAIHIDTSKFKSQLPKGTQVSSGSVTVLGTCTNCI